MSNTIKIIKALRLRGAPVSANVINAIAKGIVVANDRCLSKQWARNISNEIMRTEKKMVRRMATTSKIPVAQREGVAYI